MIISAWCMSLMVRAPHMPMAVRRAPTRFMVPSATEEGPRRISFREARGPDLYAGATREVGVRAGHAPVVASAGGLEGLGEGSAEHNGVGAGGYGPCRCRRRCGGRRR